MKKCPECGNPSYDGAPVCGNCGYKFPKPKVKAQKEEDIFQNKPISDKITGEDSTLDIIKENKYIIGAIILITLIIIGIIIVTGPNTTNTTSNPIDNSNKYSDAKFSFTYPSKWSEVSKYDELHEGAVFFEGSNGTVIEYYNVTSDSSINQINNERINNAIANGDSINKILPTQIDGKNASDVILQNYDGTYTRFISILDNGNLFVLKISGNSYNTVTSDEIESVIQSIKIA